MYSKTEIFCVIGVRLPCHVKNKKLHVFFFFPFQHKPHTNKKAFFLKIMDLVIFVFFLITIIVFWNILNKFSLMDIVGFKKIDATTVTCTTVYGTEKGDSCFAVAKKFKLPVDTFLAINPNINCVKIFVGQWLCINGFVSPWISHLLKRSFMFNQWKVS